MAINVLVVNELIDVIKDPNIIFHIYDLEDNLLKNLKLLKYVDPYSDTYFNTLQFEDLKKDCEFVKNNLKDNNIIESMKKIMDLIDDVKDDTGIFILFVGD
ncbi:MAG: hypothetical protein AABX19_01095 [Nanoarchaeota archaeon]